MREELLPRFVRIPAGNFTMGAEDGEEDERPPHERHVGTVHVSVHPVTNRQYAEFVAQTGHPAPTVRDLPLFVLPAHEAAFREIAAPYAWRGGEPPRDRADHPVTLVTYADAVAYCAWLTHRISRPVRLPSEVEWERAARGGLDRRRYPWGDDIDPSRANFLPDPALKRHRSTRPVGCYAPNGFDLYDMAGNVWEWIDDWYRPDAYRSSGVEGPPVRPMRLLRGGAWVTHDVSQLRCAHRHQVPEDSYAYSIGFRVVYTDQGQ
ncbi:MAG: formylglycine-generating enzyme family protein [Vicinamibacterales bacterium]|nr:formylglycine-generating enzyme family protein [Vicinamibacterales bacterium]